MMDGVPLNDAVEGDFAYYDMPIDNIERIEIIRGPGSALYGGYALSSVLNIITEVSSDSTEIRLNGGLRNFSQSGVISKEAGLKYSGNITSIIKASGAISYYDTEGDALLIKSDYSRFLKDKLDTTAKPLLTPALRTEPRKTVNSNVNIEIDQLKEA